MRNMLQCGEYFVMYFMTFKLLGIKDRQILGKLKFYQGDSIAKVRKFFA